MRATIAKCFVSTAKRRLKQAKKTTYIQKKREARPKWAASRFYLYAFTFANLGARY